MDYRIFKRVHRCQCMRLHTGVCGHHKRVWKLTMGEKNTHGVPRNRPCVGGVTVPCSTTELHPHQNIKTRFAFNSPPKKKTQQEQQQQQQNNNNNNKNPGTHISLRTWTNREAALQCLIGHFVSGRRGHSDKVKGGSKHFRQAITWFANTYEVISHTTGWWYYVFYELLCIHQETKWLGKRK